MTDRYLLVYPWPSELYGVSFKTFYKILNSPNVFLRKADVEHVMFFRLGVLFLFFIFIYVFTEELIIILNLIKTLNQTLINGLK